MSDKISNSSGERPAIVGGTPARSWPFRRYPEFTAEGSYDEGGFVRRWLRTVTGDPGGRPAGLPLGIALPDEISQDDVRSAFERSAEDGIAEALGEERAWFAAELAAVLSGGHRVTVVPGGSDTTILAAMFLALRELAGHLGLRRPTVGGEVIVSALARHNMARAIVRSNLVPVPVDVEPGSLCADPNKVAAKITKDTVAVVVSHQASRLASVRKIVEMARPYGIPVIEDCADAPGARSVDHFAGAGTVGLAGVFSFGAESNTLTGGGGGALIGREPRLAMETARRLRAVGDGMPAILAALLRAQLRRFPEQNAVRADVLAKLDQEAGDLPGISVLPPQPEVVVPPTNGWLFGVRLREFAGMTLDQLAKVLTAELRCHVTRICEPLSIADDDLRWVVGDIRTPHAEAAYESMLAIPAAGMLDERFSDAFKVAIEKTREHASNLAVLVIA